MTAMTEAQAATARTGLAAYDTNQATVARDAENAKRATARAAVQPIANLIAGAPALAFIESLTKSGDVAGAAGDRTVAQLANNVIQTFDGLVAIIERRMADTEPVPVPVPPAT